MKKVKKLTLKKQTITDLTNSEMNSIEGGRYTFTNGCPPTQNTLIEQCVTHNTCNNAYCM